MEFDLNLIFSITNNYDTVFRARCEHPNLYLYTELKYDKKIFSGVTFRQIKADLNAKEWPEFVSGVYVCLSLRLFPLPSFSGVATLVRRISTMKRLC
jgi:hypothetical protein